MCELDRVADELTASLTREHGRRPAARSKIATWLLLLVAISAHAQDGEGSAASDALAAELAASLAALETDGSKGLRRLEAAIRSAEARQELHAATYQAALALADAASQTREVRIEINARRTAGRLFEGDPEAAADRAASLTEQAAALRVNAFRRERPSRLGTRIVDPEYDLDPDSARAANALLVEALMLVGPVAARESGDVVTEAGAAFAAALLEATMLHAARGGLLRESPRQHDTIGIDALATSPGSSGLTYCEMQLVGEVPILSRAQWQDFYDTHGVGGVVVRVRSDEAGAVLERRLVAVSPAGAVEDAVEAVFAAWELDVAPGHREPCSKAGVRYLGVPIIWAQGSVWSMLESEDRSAEQRSRRTDR